MDSNSGDCIDSEMPVLAIIPPKKKFLNKYVKDSDEPEIPKELKFTNMNKCIEHIVQSVMEDIDESKNQSNGHSINENKKTMDIKRYLETDYELNSKSFDLISEQTKYSDLINSKRFASTPKKIYKSESVDDDFHKYHKSVSYMNEVKHLKNKYLNTKNETLKNRIKHISSSPIISQTGMHTIDSQQQIYPIAPALQISTSVVNFFSDSSKKGNEQGEDRCKLSTDAYSQAGAAAISAAYAVNSFLYSPESIQIQNHMDINGKATSFKNPAYFHHGYKQDTNEFNHKRMANYLNDINTSNNNNNQRLLYPVEPNVQPMVVGLSQYQSMSPRKSLNESSLLQQYQLNSVFMRNSSPQNQMLSPHYLPENKILDIDKTRRYKEASIQEEYISRMNNSGNYFSPNIEKPKIRHQRIGEEVEVPIDLRVKKNSMNLFYSDSQDRQNLANLYYANNPRHSKTNLMQNNIHVRPYIDETSYNTFNQNYTPFNYEERSKPIPHSLYETRHKEPFHDIYQQHFKNMEGAQFMESAQLHNEIVHQTNPSRNSKHEVRIRADYSIPPEIITSPKLPHLIPIQPRRSEHRASQLSPSNVLNVHCRICGSIYGNIRSFRMHCMKAHRFEASQEHYFITTISDARRQQEALREHQPKIHSATFDAGSIYSEQSITPKTRIKENCIPDRMRCSDDNYSKYLTHPPPLPQKQIAEVYPIQYKLQSPDSSIPDSTINSSQKWQDGVNIKYQDATATNSDERTWRQLIDNKKHVTKLFDNTCATCMDGFQDFTDWRMHMSSDHAMQSCLCRTCKRWFTNSEQLSQHLNEMHTDDVDVEFKCIYCQKFFKVEEDLIMHVRHHEASMMKSQGGPTVTEAAKSGSQVKRSSSLQPPSIIVEDSMSPREKSEERKTSKESITSDGDLNTGNFTSMKSKLLKRFQSEEKSKLSNDIIKFLNEPVMLNKENLNDRFDINTPSTPQLIKDMLSQIKPIDIDGVSKSPASYKARCVRDICDEIIVDSFRDSSPASSESSKAHRLKIFQALESFEKIKPFSFTHSVKDKTIENMETKKKKVPTATLR